MCVIDADIPIETIAYICDQCQAQNIPVWFNPTDLRKCDKIVKSKCLSKITYMSPNFKELLLIFKSTLINDNKAQNIKSRLYEIADMYDRNLEENINRIEHDHLKEILRYLLKFVPIIVLSRGEDDFVLASRNLLQIDANDQLATKSNLKNFMQASSNPHMYLFPTIKLSRNEKVENVSGAGDSASAGIIAGVIKNYSLVDTIYNGLLAAGLALQASECVSENLLTLGKNEVARAVEENIKNIKIIPLAN